MSLWGKVNASKIYLIPQINYFLFSLQLEIPGSYFKRFKSIFQEFLLKGKQQHMNMRNLQKTVKNLGLGLPNLHYSYAFAHRTLPPERVPPIVQYRAVSVSAYLTLRQFGTKSWGLTI